MKRILPNAPVEGSFDKNKLRNLRLKKGLSQQELSDLTFDRTFDDGVGLRVHPGQISRHECGHLKMYGPTYNALLRTLRQL